MAPSSRGLESAFVTKSLKRDVCLEYIQALPGTHHGPDGTARPQVVSAEDAPRFHRIISLYRERSGIPSLLNTSFNMHEEPIVCTPSDACRAFVSAQLPYLALGPFLVVGAGGEFPSR